MLYSNFLLYSLSCSISSLSSVALKIEVKRSSLALACAASVSVQKIAKVRKMTEGKEGNVCRQTPGSRKPCLPVNRGHDWVGKLNIFHMLNQGS